MYFKVLFNLQVAFNMKWSGNWFFFFSLVNYVEPEIPILLKISLRLYSQTNTPTFPWWTPFLPPRVRGAFLLPQACLWHTANAFPVARQELSSRREPSSLLLIKTLPHWLKRKGGITVPWPVHRYLPVKTPTWISKWWNFTWNKTGLHPLPSVYWAAVLGVWR